MAAAWALRLDRRAWRATRATLAFGVLGAAIVLLVLQAWRAHAELLDAQAAHARGEALVSTLHRLEAQLQPDAQLALCAVGAAAPPPAAGPSAPAWAASAADLQAQLAVPAAEANEAGAVDAARVRQLRDDAAQWQARYTEPLRRACVQGRPLGGAEAQSLSAGAAPLRLRIDSGLRDLLVAAQAAHAQGDQRLWQRVDASRRSLVLLSLAAMLLGAIALVVVRGLSLRMAEGSRRLFGEAQRRALAQDRLNLSQRRMRLLLDHIPDAVIAFDERGRVQWINPVGEAMFGATRRVLLGRPISLLLPALEEELHWPRTQPQSVSDVEPTAPPGSVDTGDDSEAAMPWTARHLEIEGFRVGASGQPPERFPVAVSLVQTRADGHRVGVCMARDQSEAQRVERMKHEFVSMVSHELRTPLTSIHGSLAVLAEGAMPLEPTVQRLVRLAHDNSERLVALVNDILDFEKLRAGQMRIQAEALDLNDAAQVAVASCEGLAQRRAVTVRVEPAAAAEPLPLATDPLRLNQVLLNLLSNAIKFSPIGGEVVLRLSRQGEAADEARATVTDQGPGVPAAFVPYLFEPFAQAANLDTRRQGGTGLGLAISRALVERMGGRIGLDPAVDGAGASFWIALPLQGPATVVDAPGG